MKLDKDLVREILLAIEASSDSPETGKHLDLEGRTQNEISYHIMLLDEAGLVVGQDATFLEPPFPYGCLNDLHTLAMSSSTPLGMVRCGVAPKLAQKKPGWQVLVFCWNWVKPMASRCSRSAWGLSCHERADAVFLGCGSRTGAGQPSG